MPAALIPPQNYSAGSSAPFQLNSKPNWSPHRMLQSCKWKKASHPGWEIMLLGPTVDTFEARADCRANELTLTRGRERTVQDRPCTLLHGPIGRFFDWLVITMLRRRPVQKSPYGTMEQSTWPVLNCALPSPGQGQFLSLAIHSGFECVHRWSQQHDR